MKRFLLFLSAATALLVACDREPIPTAPSPSAEEPRSGFGSRGPLSFPESCLEIQAALMDKGSSLDDGLYTLFLHGEEAMPVQVFCRGMKFESPMEYVLVNPDTNFSEARDSGGARFLRTSYAKLRIDLVRLELDPQDSFGASTESSGASTMTPPWNDASDAPLGVADSLDGTPTQASIDLRGSGFVFAPEVSFCINEEGNESSVEMTTDRASARLTAADTDSGARATVSNSCLARASVDTISSPIPIAYSGD